MWSIGDWCNVVSNGMCCVSKIDVRDAYALVATNESILKSPRKTIGCSKLKIRNMVAAIELKKKERTLVRYQGLDRYTWSAGMRMENGRRKKVAGEKERWKTSVRGKSACGRSIR